MELTITDTAATKIVMILEKEGRAYLRIGVKGGGCSGFQYVFDLSDAPEQEDQIFSHHGAKVLVDPMSMLYLDGTTLDFVEGLEGSFFKLQNPNISSQCGCGNSFST